MSNNDFCTGCKEHCGKSKLDSYGRYEMVFTTLGTIKCQWLNSSVSMKDLINNNYHDISIPDKENLIYWSADEEKYMVDKSSGKVVDTK